MCFLPEQRIFFNIAGIFRMNNRIAPAAGPIPSPAEATPLRALFLPGFA